MKFWDSSAIIPLCVEEAPTARVKRLAEEDPALLVWWGTQIECHSALARRRREEIITREDGERAQHALTLLLEASAGGYIEVR
jgi:uncharacterized protein with PIN domain